MSCVYEAEPVSFSCVLAVVNDVRTGAVTVDTVRKILKQVDSGLAQFGQRQPVGVSSLAEDDLLASIEQQCSMKGDVIEYIKLLPQLLQLLNLVINMRTV